MLFLFSGTDRSKAREEMNKALAKEGKKARVVRITDASTVADLQEVLRGGGMFGEKRAVVFDGVFANEEMRSIVLGVLAELKESEESFFVLEGKLDADTRKKIEKYAESSKKFDAPAGKARQGGEIFALAYALKRGDKKGLWVEYQRALARDEAPEAIHGVLFWGAKDMFIKSREAEHDRAAKFVAELAALPHKARRKGFDLEYALEYYILSINNSIPRAVNKP